MVVDYSSLLLESANIAAEYEYSREIGLGKIDFSNTGSSQIRPQEEHVTRLAWVQVPRRHMLIPQRTTVIVRTDDKKLADIVVNVVACDDDTARRKAMKEMSHLYPEIPADKWQCRLAEVREANRYTFELPIGCEHTHANCNNEVIVFADTETNALKQLQVVFPLATARWLIECSAII